jgi:nucleotide-binding universal stress UspA family protein
MLANVVIAQRELGLMYQNILVPVDGSPASSRGLDEAIRLAAALGSRIRLLHVVNELVVLTPEIAATAFTDVLDMLRNVGNEILCTAEEQVQKSSVPVESQLVEAVGGRAGDHVVQKAREWPAQLIVCGTHGRRGLRRALLGSDAEHIVRNSPVPVLLVRDAQ